jgi:hypothetical protein
MDLVFTISYTGRDVLVWLTEGRTPNVPIAICRGCDDYPASVLWETISLERRSGVDALHERAHDPIQVTASTSTSVYVWVIPCIAQLLSVGQDTHIVYATELDVNTYDFGLMTVYRGLLYQINAHKVMQVIDLSGMTDRLLYDYDSETDNDDEEGLLLTQMHTKTWEFSAVFDRDLYILGDTLITRHHLS